MLKTSVESVVPRGLSLCTAAVRTFPSPDSERFCVFLLVTSPLGPWKTDVRVWDDETRRHITVTLAVTIDWQAVAQELGPNAYRDKSRKSKLLDGGIVGEIVSK